MPITMSSSTLIHKNHPSGNNPYIMPAAALKSLFRQLPRSIPAITNAAYPPINSRSRCMLLFHCSVYLRSLFRRACIFWSISFALQVIQSSLRSYTVFSTVSGFISRRSSAIFCIVSACSFAISALSRSASAMTVLLLSDHISSSFSLSSFLCFSSSLCFSSTVRLSCVMVSFSFFTPSSLFSLFKASA